MNFARWVISIAAVLLLALVGIGFALPGDWTATSELGTELAPEELWAEMVDLRRWDGWAPMMDVEATYSDPPSGEGATRSWDSQEWGQGEVRIVEARENRELRYVVAIEDGSIAIRGHIQLIPDASGPTRIVWTESGDFGWNPFLAFIALGMERTQGANLESGLRALVEMVEERGDGDASAPEEGRAEPATGDGAAG